MNDDSSGIVDVTSEEGSAIAQNILDAGAKAIETGQLGEAEKIFRSLVNMAPENPEAYNGLGVVFGMIGNIRSAEYQFRKAIKYAPDVGMFHRNLGSILLNREKFRRATDELGKALSLDPDDNEARLMMAIAHKGRKNLPEFEAEIQQVLENDVRHPEANHEFGCFLIANEKLEEGQKHLKLATESAKAGPIIFINYGNSLIMTENLPAAHDAFARAVDLFPLNIDCLMGLGTVERNLGELQSALKHVEKASSLAPAHPIAKNLLGTIYKEMGDYEQAMGLYDDALSLSSDFIPARINRSIIHLLRGEWTKGFLEFETRREGDNSMYLRHDLDCPLWDGTSLEGRSIYLYAEQGFGDAIQFSRFVISIAAQSGKVVLEVQSELRTLMKSLNADIEVVAPGNDHSATDVHASLMSLGSLLKLQDAKSVFSKPYLVAPEPTKELEALMKGVKGLKVGLNWKGSSSHKEDAKRSIDLKMFDALIATDGVHFFNLNVSPDKEVSSSPDGLIDLSEHISDFADAASIIGQLDLVISVDTATVHLAGAIGCSCWALISFVPDWRWGLERSDTPWYESVELYRQPALGEWSSVFDRLSVDLEKMRET